MPKAPIRVSRDAAELDRLLRRSAFVNRIALRIAHRIDALHAKAKRRERRRPK